MTDAERELLLLLAKIFRGTVPMSPEWSKDITKLIAEVERSAE